MGGISGGQQSSKTQSTIPKFQQQYLKDLYGQAQQQAQDPLQFYPGSTVAAQDPATTGYYNSALNYAQNGNAGLNQAAGYNANVLSGQYLSPDSNPYLRGTYDTAARAVTDNYRDAVLPQIQTRFGLAGQLNSAGALGAKARAQQALGTSLGDLANNFYGGAYADERQRQEAARSFSPVLAADQASRLDLQRSVGQSKQDYQQSLLDELIQRFDFGQNEPGLRLSRYAGLLGNPITLSNSSSKGYNVGLKIE